MSRKIKSVKTFRSFLVPEAGEDFKETSDFLESMTIYNEHGGITESSRFSPDGETEEKIIMQYNDKGSLIEEAQYHEEEFTEKKIYIRDADEKIIAEEKHYLDGSIEKTEYIKDEKGNPVKKIMRDDEGREESTEEVSYNERNKAVESRKFDEDKRLIEKLVITYDDKDRIIQTEEWDIHRKASLFTSNEYTEKGDIAEIRVNDSKGKLISRMRSTYDEDGLLSKRIMKDQSSYSRNSITNYFYDENKRLAEEEVLGPDGKTQRRISYEYDEEGNLISNLHYEMDTSQSGSSQYWKNRMEYEFF